MQLDSARRQTEGESIRALICVAYRHEADQRQRAGIICEFRHRRRRTDNFPTRYLVNDACRAHRQPNVYGSIFSL